MNFHYPLSHEICTRTHKDNGLLLLVMNIVVPQVPLGNVDTLESCHSTVYTGNADTR